VGIQVLTINPGSTSTKIAWFDSDREVWRETVRHDPAELAAFTNVADQFDFRRRTIEEAIAAHGSSPETLGAVCGRGGLVDPIPGGTYVVDEPLISRLRVGTRPTSAASSRRRWPIRSESPRSSSIP